MNIRVHARLCQAKFEKVKQKRTRYDHPDVLTLSFKVKCQTIQLLFFLFSQTKNSFPKQTFTILFCCDMFLEKQHQEDDHTWDIYIFLSAKNNQNKNGTRNKYFEKPLENTRVPLLTDENDSKQKEQNFSLWHRHISFINPLL